MVLAEKVCPRCGVTKPVEGFAKRRAESFASWCKDCTREATRRSAENSKGDVAMLRQETKFWKMRAQKLSAQLQELGETPNN